mmetsp:Transcript_11046/g.28384  ORF Transcript_11046/g.28384 Transcript_11046/m.28384 type:complete len:211 (-) Transcript_11046:822-1454(-)
MSDRLERCVPARAPAAGGALGVGASESGVAYMGPDPTTCAWPLSRSIRPGMVETGGGGGGVSSSGGATRWFGITLTNPLSAAAFTVGPFQTPSNSLRLAASSAADVSSISFSRVTMSGCSSTTRSPVCTMPRVSPAEPRLRRRSTLPALFFFFRRVEKAQRYLTCFFRGVTWPPMVAASPTRTTAMMTARPPHPKEHAVDIWNWPVWGQN